MTTLRSTHQRGRLLAGLPLFFGLTLAFGGCANIIGLSDLTLEDEDSAGMGGETGSGGDRGSGGSTVIATCDTGCDDENECTSDRCVDDACVHAPLDAGDECSEGLCNGLVDAPACVPCIDDAPDDRQDTGCPAGAPTCRTTGPPVCVGCSNAADCDDEIECTNDLCEDGVCSNATLSAGTECDGGYCDGTKSANACLTCLDDASGGSLDTGCSLSAPVCSGGSCLVCTDDASGTSVDAGCSGSSPICDQNTCVSCIDDTDGTGRDLGCDSSRPYCVSGACSPCINLELLKNGDFEDGESNWTPSEGIGSVVEDPTCMSTGCNHVFEFTTAADQYENLYQDVPIPENVTQIVLGGRYMSNPTSGVTADESYYTTEWVYGDYLAGFFYQYDLPDETDSSEFLTFVDTDGNANPGVTEWRKFSGLTVTDMSSFLSWYDGTPYSGAAMEVEYNLVGNTNDANDLIHYLVDDLSMLATVCVD